MWLPLVFLAASAFGQVVYPGGNVDASRGQLKSADSRIVGGVEAPAHSVPFQAWIQTLFPPNEIQDCGGSLIRAQWVLTAMHCIIRDVKEGRGKSVIVLGVVDTSVEEPGPYVQTFVPAEIVLLDGYEEMIAKKNWTEDVALIKLDRPALLTNYVNTIRIPTKDDKSKTFEGAVATISGWGRFAESSNDTAPLLRAANVTVISNDQCLNAFGPGSVDKNAICTSGDGGKGLCHGDSGGPLYIHDSNQKPFLIGVGSFIYHNCEEGVPSGFMRVTEFVDWINDVAFEENQGSHKKIN